MPEVLFNNSKVPLQTDMWNLIPDIKTMGESINAPIPVANKAARNALTGPGGGAVPDGTMVVRLDLYGSMDVKIAGGWLEGDTGWVNITPLSGFTGADGLGVRRIGSLVTFRGTLVASVAFPSATPGVEVFTIPVGFRPSAYTRIGGVSFGGATARTFAATITTAGVMNVGAVGPSDTSVRFNATWTVD